MNNFASIVGRGEQEFNPATGLVTSKIFGMLSNGTTGIVATAITTRQDFMFWYELQTKTLEAIRRSDAEAAIALLPRGRLRKRVSG